MKAIPFYILLGLCCGFVSLYTTYMLETIEGFFSSKKESWKIWLAAGIPLCVIIFFLPNLYGEGYLMIAQLLKGNYEIITQHTFLSIEGNKPALIIIISFLMIGFKAITSSLTMAAGGNGGTFAPSLIIGGLVGFLFAFIVNESGYYTLNTSNFIIVAMAGVLAGVMHAPLTGVFLLAEITGGYTLFVPLMIVTALSYFITRKYIRHSMYHKVLVQKDLIQEEEESYL
jgi:CIC family chloride channel protein